MTFTMFIVIKSSLWFLTPFHWQMQFFKANKLQSFECEERMQHFWSERYINGIVQLKLISIVLKQIKGFLKAEMLYLFQLFISNLSLYSATKYSTLSPLNAMNRFTLEQRWDLLCQRETARWSEDIIGPYLLEKVNGRNH